MPHSALRQRLSLKKAVPQLLKPRAIFWPILYGLNRLRKKTRLAVRFRENDPQGLKPTAHCAAFAARINPCPDTRPAFPRVFPQPVKPVPFILRRYQQTEALPRTPASNRPGVAS